MSSQHVHDPQMIIRCSGLRGVANNELSVRNRLGTDRQAGMADREASVQVRLVV